MYLIGWYFVLPNIIKSVVADLLFCSHFSIHTNHPITKTLSLKPLLLKRAVTALIEQLDYSYHQN